ncbi:MAG: glycosyltransferase [Planctomycetota bacterium]|nr:glycosyltransferase [Planctomycetota bacterium]
MRVSVVIPTLNAGSLLPLLFDRLRSQKPATPDEIIVVDSGSSDESRALATNAGARLVEWTEPFNHGLARDAAISAATGDIVLLTVQDALPAADDWLARISAHFLDDSVAGVSTRQIPPPGGPLELQVKAAAEAQAGSAPVRIRLADHPEYRHYTPAQKMALYRFDNVCSAVRRSVWEQIPFGACRYAEDLLWARTVLEAGHTLVYDPSAPVVHAHRRSFIYEFRRALLDAWMLDELFGFRYRLGDKLDRVKALARPEPEVPKPAMAARCAAARTYAAHGLARFCYNTYRLTLKPLGLGRALLVRLTRGI